MKNEDGNRHVKCTSVDCDMTFEDEVQLRTHKMKHHASLKMRRSDSLAEDLDVQPDPSEEQSHKANQQEIKMSVQGASAASSEASAPSVQVIANVDGQPMCFNMWPVHNVLDSPSTSWATSTSYLNPADVAAVGSSTKGRAHPVNATTETALQRTSFPVQSPFGNPSYQAAAFRHSRKKKRRIAELLTKCQYLAEQNTQMRILYEKERKERKRQEILYEKERKNREDELAKLRKEVADLKEDKILYEKERKERKRQEKELAELRKEFADFKALHRNCGAAPEQVKVLRKVAILPFPG